MMESGFRESMSSRQIPSLSSSSSNNNSSDAENFECNICFDLAQDPIVTLCGHLFCWPCLYNWLHYHSRSQECPVCKALIEEEKLVPLYGRGKNSTDPRSKLIPGMEIPHRPMGQRPETASPPDPNANAFAQQGFGFMGGFGHFGGIPPVAAPRFGNFALSEAFEGILPSFFNIQRHGFRNATMYGAGAGLGFPYRYSNVFNGGHAHGFPQRISRQQQADFILKFLLLVIGFSVVVTLVWS